MVMASRIARSRCPVVGSGDDRRCRFPKDEVDSCGVDGGVIYVSGVVVVGEVCMSSWLFGGGVSGSIGFVDMIDG